MLLVTPEKIAAVMALLPVPHSFAELDDRVAHGLPKDALKASVELLTNSRRDVPMAIALDGIIVLHLIKK